MLLCVARGGGVNEAQVARTNAAFSMLQSVLLYTVSIAARVAASGVWRSMSSGSDAYACYYRVYAQRGAL